MVAPKKEIHDQVLKDWMQEFTNKNTKQGYLAALRKFKKNLGIKSLDEYIKQTPNATEDIKHFLITLKDKPSKTKAAYVAAVKSFFVDNNVPLDENGLRKLRRRGFMPKRVKAETRDRKPTKPQLQRILNYMDIKGRAQVLFLTSSGARVGESLQLLEEDFNLEADPPRAFIRAEYTKGGVGARTVYFSYEARDAIKDWLAIKTDQKKRNGKQYSDNKVFDWSVWTARDMWNRAVKKADLDSKDDVTDRRIYHLHSLRKFFRTQIGLDSDLIHALMGHVEYLDSSYVRHNQEDIAKAYLEAMPNVSVYEMEINQELKQKADKIELENLELKKRVLETETKLKKLEITKEENLELKDRISKTEAKLVQIEKLLVQVLNGKNT